MNYEPLALDIKQNGGHDYHQVWRDDNAAVYEQRGHYGQLLGYESIAIKRQEAKEIFGRSYSAREIYPSSEDWGTLGFTKNNLEDAIETAKALSKRARKRQSQPTPSTTEDDI